MAVLAFEPALGDGRPRTATAAAPARRIDRLARGAHRFHRFAHHPLCDAYAGEVIRIGRRARLCRGCTCVAGGGLAGLAAALTIPPLPILVQAALLAACVLVAGGGLLRRRQGRSAPGAHPRWPKLVTRALPSAVLFTTLVEGARAGGAPGWSLSGVALALLVAAVVAYRRRGPDRTPCDGCGEGGTGICSGFRPIARREAAFSRAAARLLRS